MAISKTGLVGSGPKVDIYWVICLSRRSGSFWAAVTLYKVVSFYIANAGSDYCLKLLHCLILVSQCYKFISRIKDRIYLPYGIPFESPKVHFSLIVFAWHLPALCRCVLHLLDVWSGHCKLLNHQVHLTVNIQKHFLLTTSALGIVWTRTWVQDFDKNEITWLKVMQSFPNFDFQKCITFLFI